MPLIQPHILCVQVLLRLWTNVCLHTETLSPVARQSCTIVAPLFACIDDLRMVGNG